MSGHQHHNCEDSSCDHPDGAAGPAEEKQEDFNEFLEETHPCCQKDSEERARALKVRAALDKVDPSQIAERARKAAFSLGGALSASELPECRVGVDYPALRQARKVARVAAGQDVRSGVEGMKAEARYRVDSEDDDDDDDLDYLLDDPELLRMERARVEGMQANASRLETLRALGFGVHLEVPESQLEATANGQFRGAVVVVHLYDPDSTLSASLDLLLETKAGSYMGTRFVRCRVKPGSAMGARMRVQRVPALACYKGSVRVAYTEEMTQFGDSAGVDPGAVDRWLTASGTLEFDPPSSNAFQDYGIGSRPGVGVDSEDDGGEEREARYDCGLDGCGKTFAHNHFLAAGGGGLPQGFDLPL